MTFMTIEQVESKVNEANLQWKRCSQGHWQVIGGIAVVNVHRGKSGSTVYVQGMGKGTKVSSPSQVEVRCKSLNSASNAEAS